MGLFELIILIGAIGAIIATFTWIVIKLDDNSVAKSNDDLYTNKAMADVEGIFNDEFRQELRNRGRLHFEKIIGENAMFLQQDLRLTTSQLNDYMKQEITKSLQDAFKKYEESIDDAKQLAVDSIAKTQEAVEQQRQTMGQQLQTEIAKEKKRVISHFEENLGSIINYYLLTAIGDQIDLNDQINYIIGNMEANKEAIIRDITDGS